MSSTQSRAAVRLIGGFTSAATDRAIPNPVRGEWAIVASVIIVRGRPHGSGAIGVAWVSTTLPAPSPSTMVMTMVRASGQANSARTGTPSRAGEPERHVHHEDLVVAGVVVDDEVAERIRVVPGAVPRVEPVGDDVVRLADAGDLDDRGDRRVRAAAAS